MTQLDDENFLIHSEIADHDIGVPIFTTPITGGYRYPHNDTHEIMQVRMAAMVLSPPTRV